MGRTPREDYVPLMIAVARRKLEAGDEVRISEIATELDVSPSLVNFYFGDRQSLVDAAWKNIFLAHVDDDQLDVAASAQTQDWAGIRELVRRVFSEERDVVHMTHTRAAVDARRNERLAEIMREVHDTTIDGWAELIRLALEQGIVTTTLDPEALSRLVVAVPMGVAIVSPELSVDERAHLATAWYTMLRLVLDPEFHGRADPG